MTNAKTLPRCSMHLRNSNGNEQFTKIQTTTHAAHMGQDATEQMLTIPLQNAPRPMTLPTRGASNRVKKAAELCGDMSKLIQRANGKENTNNNNNDNAANNSCFDQEANPSDDKLSPCESPSYMTNTFYKFPEQQSVATTNTTGTPNKEPLNPCAEANALPLPSREGKKHIKTNAKRHVRKYPLIIPANGVQRTLSKVTDMQTNTSLQAAQQQQQLQQQQQQQLKNANAAVNAQQPLETAATIRSNLAIEHHHSTEADGKQQLDDTQQHTYQNLDHLDDDTASLQFESILEADSNKCNVLQSPDVTDGFYNFSIQKEHYHKGKEVDSNKISGLYVNEDELRNLDIQRSVRLNVSNPTINSTKSTQSDEPEVRINADESSTPTAAALAPACSTNTLEKQKPNKSTAENELAGNALFKKVRETVEMAMSRPAAMETTSNATTTDATTTNTAKEATATGANGKQRAQTEAEYFAATASRLADSNSVSCEDLLEFSDKKPKGCERGVDSDEVRIMMKVLGKASTPDRCLHVLEFINWDVHKAIKLIKLQNILSNANLSLTESIEVLQKYDWDLHVTAIKLRALKT